MKTVMTRTRLLEIISVTCPISLCLLLSSEKKTGMRISGRFCTILSSASFHRVLIQEGFSFLVWGIATILEQGPVRFCYPNTLRM